MEIPRFSWRRNGVFILLLALVLPVIAACGGGAPATAPTSPPAPAAATATAPTAAPAAAASAAPPATGADTKSFLVYGNPGEPDSIDGMATNSGQALVVAEQIQETLVGRAEGKVGISPLLAEKWTPNADTTEWTFTLRKGVKFHDGTDFNADAVIFNFQRMSDPKSEFGYRDQGKTYPGFSDIFGGFVGDANTLWKGIEKVDDSTVKILVTKPVPLLPEYLSASYFTQASPEAVKKAGAKYGTPEGGAVGTGAFRFESWTAGESIVLVRNDDYWGEKAKMPGAVVRFIKDAPARLAELQAGSIDFTINLPPDARETLKSSTDLKEVPVEPFNVAYIAMNFNNKPFDDPRVRQAIAYAINKQEILDGFYGGIGTVATTFLPEGLAWARSDTIETYGYNPEKAKELLNAAGFANGLDTMTLADGSKVPIEFWYMPVSRPYFPTPKPVAEAIASQLADVGIKVELKTEDWATYLDNEDAGKKNGMWMLGWTGDYGDPNNFLYVFFGPTAKTKQGYANQQLMDLLLQANTAKSQEEASKLFKQAGEIIAKDVPRIPIVHAPPVYAANKAVEGWTPSPFGHEPWKMISVQK